MQGAMLPLFPLPLVVFPRVPLPLHIFEERYKELIGDAIAGATEFGIVLAKEEGIVNAGCTVIVEKVIETYPDGRMDILARGVRRFELLSINEEKNYLQGEVEFFDDEDTAPVPDEVRAAALQQYRTLVEAGGSRTQGDPDLNDPQLSFQIAQGLPDTDFLNLLLRNRSETARLKELNQYLADFVPRHRKTTRMKALAPLNGFGGKLAGV